MIRVRFVVNRFGWDTTPNDIPIESASKVKEILAEQLPNLGDFMDLGLRGNFRPVVRHRNSLALADNPGGIHWVVQMKTEDERVFELLRHKGWDITLQFT